MQFRASLLAGLIISLGASTAFAQVAVPQAQGSRKAKPKSFRKGVVKGLQSKGSKAIWGKTLYRASKRAGVDAYDPRAAEEAGARHLLLVSISKLRRKYLATGRLIDIASGSELKKVRVSYRSRRKATSAGAKMGRIVGKWIQENVEDEEPEVVAEERPSRAIAAKPRAIASATDTDSSSAEERTEKARPTIKDEDPAASTKTTKKRRRSRRGRENAYVQGSFHMGTQVASAYTVAVGSEVTGLAYRLSPLVLFGGKIRGQIPKMGLGMELEAMVSPVSFQVDVEPALAVSNPGGRFFNFGGMAFWNFDLTRFGSGGKVSAAPTFTVAYSSMTAESQGENSVVISWSSIDASIGGRLGVQANRNLAFELDGRLGYILGFSEGPTVTGNGGKGLALRVGASGRYWFTKMIAAHVGLGYQYQRVGLSGRGDRIPFQGDPELVDATIFTGDLKLSTGVTLAI